MRDPFFLLCGVFCLYPLIFFALPAFLIGRYRPRFRSPIALDDRTEGERPITKEQRIAAMRKAMKREDKIGYGPTQ